MDVRILGVVEAVAGGDSVALGARKQRALFAMLALEANTPVSADRLAEGLWGESPPASAHKMVQVYVSQLRKALHDADAEIVTRGRGYELACGEQAVDLHRAERLVAAATAEPLPNRHARAALALWRGPPLADLADEPFAAVAIRRCEDLRLRAEEVAIDADLAGGRHATVLREVAALAAENPLHEGIQGQHLLALYRSGRQAEALDAYRSTRRRIVDAIGAEPGPELRRLHDEILRQDDAVAAVPARPRARRPRHVRLAMAMVLAAAAATAVALALAPTGGGDPAKLRLGEDSVGLLDATATRLRTVEPVGRDPEAVVLGAGSVWVANTLDDTVTRIDSDEGRRTTIGVGAHPTALAFGAGSLWVVSGDDGTIAQVDPTTDRVVQRIPVGGQPAALAAGHGAVWVAQPRENAVTRIDLSSGKADPPIAAGTGPSAIATGAGAVWVTAEDSDQLIRIEPGSGTVTAAIGIGHGPDAVAIAGDAVWVANGADGTVSRVDPAVGVVTGTIRVGAQVTALAADGAGALASDEQGVVVRIDRAASHITTRLPTGVSVHAIAGDGNDVWIAAGAARDRHVGGTLTSYVGDCGQPCPVDPAFPLSQTFDALGLVYDGLVGYRRAPGVAGGTIVPALASALPAPGDDGRTYTFTLRPGLHFADGREVRGIDVLASLERAIRLGHELLPGFFDAIRGAPACARRPERCSLSRGVLTRDRTVTIRLRRPDPLLLHKLANPAASVVPSGTPDDLEGPRPPGTGPYRIDAVADDGTIRLARNPEFSPWSAARPDGFADAIVLRPSTDLGTRLDAVEHGRSDVTAVDNGGRRLQPAQLAGILTRRPGRVASAPRLSTDFMFLNVRERPFNDVRVRRAVNLATDRARMVELAGGPSAAAPACSVVPPGLPHTRPACRYTANPSPAGIWRGPDVAQARQLIAASGTRGARVTVWTDTDKLRYGRYFVTLLSDLGFKPRLKVVEAGFDYFHAVGDSRTHAQMGMFGWLADYPDPATFYEPIFSCSGRVPSSSENLNLSQLCDPALDELAARAKVSDGQAATEAWAAAERRLTDLAPAVPLVSRRRAQFISTRAGNVQQNPFLGPLLEQIWVR